MQKIYKNILLAILIIVPAISYYACSNKDEIVLARIGNLEIYGSDYMQRFKTVKQRLSLPDNGQVRMNFLNSYIDEKLLLVESENLGYQSDAAAIEKRNAIKLQKLLDIYLDKEVYNPIDVTDDDLKKHFARMNIKLRVRHLYTDNKKSADSLNALVKSGISFKKLAKDLFNDPRLRESGGDLGYMGFDDMQMDFAEAAYKLKAGEVSQPVKTNYGYSIIKVEDRLGNPFLTESEFLKQKSAVSRSYNAYIKKRAAKDHVKQLERQVDINQPVFEQLYYAFKSRVPVNNILEATDQNLLIDDNAVLLTSGAGIWTVKTYKEKAAFTSEQQRNWIKNKEFFKEFILGLASRELVIKRARQKKYDELDEYRLEVNKAFNSYQIERLKEDILAAIPTPQDSLEYFYNNNKNLFIEPGRVNLREIVLNNDRDAQKIKQLILAGRSFQDVAREYSINRHTAVYGGEMGFVDYKQLGPYKENVIKLKAGEWTGPFKRGHVYFYWQCIEQQPARLPSFTEAREEIISKYKAMKFEMAMQQKINDIRSRTQVAAFPQKLRDLKYN